jgi:hypothetical protein
MGVRGTVCRLSRTHQNLFGLFAGLLVAACVNRAPEGTFGAAVAEVGVLDLLKASTLGRCHDYY